MEKYKLTPEAEARLPEWRDMWIARAMSTEPMSAEECAIADRAVRGLYAAAKLPAPVAVVMAGGPISATIAAGIAAAVWHLREHPEKHVELCGRQMSENDLLRAAAQACAQAVTAAQAALLGVPMETPATSEATRAATSDATRAAPSAATRAATSAATSDATLGATIDAAWDATWAATSEATRAATSDATRAATRDATQDSTRHTSLNSALSETLAATRGATLVATLDATIDGTMVGTQAAAWEATRTAAMAGTQAAAWDATMAAIPVATIAGTQNATWEAARIPPLFLACLRVAYGCMTDSGNFWPGPPSFVSFFKHVAGLQLDYSRWGHYEQLAIHSGPRLMHPRFCIVSDRPTVLKIDEQRRPHCADGPSHVWRDGFSLYHWRGVRVPAQWIEAKDTVDPRLVLSWSNVEQRRALAEILGWARVLDVLEPRVIDADEDASVGVLLEVDLPDAPGSRFLTVLCGTGREFVLPVPSEMKTALQANAWTYGIDGLELRGLEART